MIEVINKYINPVFRYNFHQGPANVPDISTAIQNGLNCIALAHLALKDLFDYSLPPSLHCYEMFSDEERFLPIDAADEMQKGDLVWFGHSSPRIPIDEFVPHYDDGGTLTNWMDNPVKHVAIYSGEKIDDFMMLHATYIEGTNVIWPLKKFADYVRYEKIYKISRLMASVHI